MTGSDSSAIVLRRQPVESLSSTKVEIPEVRYKADLELHDRYVGFSSEVLRMALAGMAAVGAVVGLFVRNGVLMEPVKSRLFVGSVLGALFLLALASACALSHRFFASDGMYYHLRAIKQLILIEENDLAIEAEIIAAHKATVCEDEKRRNRQFTWAGKLLFSASVMLIAGVVSLGLGFAAILLA